LSGLRRHPDDHGVRGLRRVLQRAVGVRVVTNARPRLPFMGETMSSPYTALPRKAWGTSRFPTPLHRHA
jgi:hypothetical protein